MTDDFENDLDQSPEEQAQKKKKGEGDAAASGRGRETLQVSDAAQELMQARGLTIGQVKEILRTWRHLDSKEVAVRLAEFGKDVAKASAHIIVSFSDAGYAVMLHFLKQAQRLASMARKMTPENRQKIQNKHDVNLG